MRFGLPAYLLLVVCSINAESDQIRRRPFASPATGCLENRLLRLRLECEGSLDDVARLRMKKDQSESCRAIQQDSSSTSSSHGQQGPGGFTQKGRRKANAVAAEAYRSKSKQTKLRKYITCIDMALTSTKCRRDRYVFGREVERRKRQVGTYNWDCNLQMQNYDYVMCDSKTLLNRHLACGTTFDRSIVNLNFELDEDKEKLCSSLTDYKHCVTPLIKNDACSGNKNLISRLLHFSRAVVGEYQTSCKTIAMKHMMEARQVEDVACLPEDLREKVLTCQQSAYRTIRARDVHSETDICEELDLMKECIDNALKETSCSRDLSSMRVANDTTAESYARYNVKCRRF